MWSRDVERSTRRKEESRDIVGDLFCSLFTCPDVFSLLFFVKSPYIYDNLKVSRVKNSNCGTMRNDPALSSRSKRSLNVPLNSMWRKIGTAGFPTSLGTVQHHLTTWTFLLQIHESQRRKTCISRDICTEGSGYFYTIRIVRRRWVEWYRTTFVALIAGLEYTPPLWTSQPFCSTEEVGDRT